MHDQLAVIAPSLAGPQVWAGKWKGTPGELERLKLHVQVLCALVSSSDDKQRWLCAAGIMPLLHRLTLNRSLGEVPPGQTPLLITEFAFTACIPLASDRRPLHDRADGHSM